MNKVFKAATSVGTAALLLSGVAGAAVPMEAMPGFFFDQWSASQASGKGVVITTDVCTDKWICGSAITGDGFYQRQITEVGKSTSYFQTIITDAGMGRDIGAENLGDPDKLTFSDESFVQTGNNDGIADKQGIKELELVTTGTKNSERFFKNETILQVGWAASGVGTDLKLYQGIYDTKKEGFRTDFWLGQVESQANQGILITSRVGLGGTWGDLGKAGSEFQDFVFVELKGSMNNTSGLIDITNNSSFATANTMEWTSGQDIKATWVGQKMQSTLGQTFIYEGYDNVSTKNTYDLVSTFSLSKTDINPTYWSNAVWTPVNQRDTWNDANPKFRPTNPSWY